MSHPIFHYVVCTPEQYAQIFQVADFGEPGVSYLNGNLLLNKNGNLPLSETEIALCEFSGAKVIPSEQVDHGWLVQFGFEREEAE